MLINVVNIKFNKCKCYFFNKSVIKTTAPCFVSRNYDNQEKSVLNNANFKYFLIKH